MRIDGVHDASRTAVPAASLDPTWAESSARLARADHREGREPFFSRVQQPATETRLAEEGIRDSASTNALLLPPRFYERREEQRAGTPHELRLQEAAPRAR
jgi:hypothetical protein